MPWSYARRVRRSLIIALLAAGLVACGSSGHVVTSTRIEFGTTGGNIRPQKYVITEDASSERRLRAALAHLTSRRCPGTLPDVASEYIRFQGRTITVHGSCELTFTHIWDQLHAMAGS